MLSFHSGPAGFRVVINGIVQVVYIGFINGISPKLVIGTRHQRTLRGNRRGWIRLGFLIGKHQSQIPFVPTTPSCEPPGEASLENSSPKV